jgi:hypothetical protein
MTKYIIKTSTIKNVINKVKNIKNNGDPISVSNIAEEIRNLSAGTIDTFMTSSITNGTNSGHSIGKSFKEIPWIKCFDNFTEDAENRFANYTNITTFPSINIKTSSTYNMFQGCTSLETIGTVGLYNVTKLDQMFYNCSKLTSISFDNHSTKATAQYMFYGCTLLKNINGLDGLKITNGSHMFQNCLSLEDMPQIDCSEMTNGSIMFASCGVLKHLTTTDFPVMTNGASMFSNAVSIDNLEDVTCPSATNTSYMFNGCRQLTKMIDMPPNVTDISGMYSGCTSIEEITLSNVENVTLAPTLFKGCTQFTEVGEFIFPKCTSVSQLFADCSNLTKVGGIEIGGASSGGYLRCFEGTQLEELGYLKAPNITGFNSSYSSNPIFYNVGGKIKKCGDVVLSSLKSATSLFYGCSTLQEIGNIDISAAIDAKQMFYNCKAINKIGNISCEKLTDASTMFYSCSNLTHIPVFNTNNISIAKNMFYGCSLLEEVDISLPKATNVYGMFDSCTKLAKVKITNVENIVDWSRLFYKCSALQEVTLEGRPQSDITTTDMFRSVPSTGGILFYDGRYDYSNIIAAMPSGWTAISTYTPTECVELHITADNVKAKNTTTTIYWTAITNGIEELTGKVVEGVEVTGIETSEPFEQNTSYDEVAIREISFTYMGVTATTTIEQAVWIDQDYTVNLNNQWRLSQEISNPDSELYDGVYESYSNRGLHNTGASMFITISGYDTFKFYIRSNAESSCDYVMVGNLDQTLANNTSTSSVKAHTSGYQQSGTKIGAYKLVEFTNIDEGEHTIQIIYRKDGSVNSGTDSGYILIPYVQ